MVDTAGQVSGAPGDDSPTIEMPRVPVAASFDRRAVEGWFRRRGLPMFVRSDERGSRLLQRAVPALVFLLVLDPISTLVTRLVDVPQAEFERRMANTAYVFPLLALIIAGVVVPV